MCQLKTTWNDENLQIENLDFHLDMLQELEQDGLVIIKDDGIEIPEKGRPFVRNICMAFDKKLHQQKMEKSLFSMTI